MDTIFPSIDAPMQLRPFGSTGGGSFAHRVQAASFLLRQRDFGTLMPLIWEALFGAAEMVLLRLDLKSFRGERFRRYALSARPAEQRDVAVFCDAHGLGGQERRDAAARLFMLYAGIQTCYVVENSSGDPCFLQWLIPFSENRKLHQVYGKWYPDLRSDEAIVEHAFLLPRYRGNGLLPCATAKILEIAREAGVRSIVTFIPTWNSNSLNSFMRLGFRPYLRRSDRKIFGVRFRRVQPLSFSTDAKLPGCLSSVRRTNRGQEAPGRGVSGTATHQMDVQVATPELGRA
jgi:GNAT superfamily N-acetyltransferase